jgi:hypothetical protein
MSNNYEATDVDAHQFQPPILASGKLAIPPDRERMVEAGLRTFQELFAERDRLADALQKEQNRSGMLQVEVDAKDREVADLRTRLSVLEVQRDRERAESAVLKTFILNQRSQLEGMAQLLEEPETQ